MGKAKEITLISNPACDVMEYNGYIRHWLIINDNTILITYNKEYFN